MSLTTEHAPSNTAPSNTAPARPSMLVRRRIATYFVGGVDKIPGLVDVLAHRGYIVHDLSVDIRDGVKESSMFCAILVADGEIELLLERLRRLPSVVSSELV